MPQPLSAKDFDAMVQELGSVEAAMRWAQANGYKVNWNDASIELPPLPGQQPVYDQPAGGLSAATLQAEAAPEEGADAEVDAEEEGALPSGGGGGLGLLGYLKDQQRTRKEVFDEGQKYIAQAYAGPSLSQQLFALSKALLSPKPYRGFAGTMANVSTALSDVSKEQQEAKQKRLLAEAQLLQTYKMKTADDMFEEAKLRYMIDKADKDAAAKAAAAQAKANAPVRGIAVGDRLVNPYTNEDISPPVGSVKSYQGRRFRFLGGDQYDRNNWQEVR